MNPEITLPARTESGRDLLDLGLDILRTCKMALGCDSSDLEPQTITFAMSPAIVYIEAVRERLDKLTV